MFNISVIIYQVSIIKLFIFYFIIIIISIINENPSAVQGWGIESENTINLKTQPHTTNP